MLCGADMKPRTKELEISPSIYPGDCRVLKDTDKKLFYLEKKLSILEKIACILYTVFEYIKLSYISIHQNTLQKYK